MTSLAGAAPNLRLANRLGLAAIALTGLVAAAGLLIPGLYRDREILIEATRADNLFQLAVAVPLSLAALGAARRGSINGQLIVFGTLMYLAYFFGLYAVAAVVGGLTIAQVTIVGLAIWALLLGLPALDATLVGQEIGKRLFRRTTVAFLLLVAGFHIPLWVGQILGAAVSGQLPAALIEFGWLNTPVYTFDLAFALPLAVVAATFLARGDPRGPTLAVSFLWFSLLLAADMVVEQLWIAFAAGTLDASQAIPFGMIALLSGLVVAPTLARRPREDAIKTRAVRAA